LVQNSFKTPSKFSQLDVLMNKTVLAILFVLILIVSYLSTSAIFANDEKFDTLFYAGFNTNTSEPWPYLPDSFQPPEWQTSTNNWVQFFFLYMTLLNNFIPLSLYVTIELVTWCMLWFVYADIEMYDDTTNTRAVARSTIVSDLGRIQYIFSDKTGTLTQNVMRFKRCSVDGMVFGAPIQRSRPGMSDNDGIEPSSFHPLRMLLVGRFQKRRQAGLEGMGGTVDASLDNKLTFNAEMFLRVMSLCHTVVVEKDIDNKENIGGTASIASSTSNTKSIGSVAKGLFMRKRADTAGSITSPLSSVAEGSVFSPDDAGGNRARTSSVNSLAYSETMTNAKNSDGVPLGYAY
jgi:phospholipid-transporting ATPase